MKVWIGLLCALLTVACASKRERRQSVYTDQHTAMHVQHDTAWHQQQWDSYTTQWVEVEEWSGYTVPSVTDTVPFESNTLRNRGYTRPFGRHYRRTRSIKLSSGRNTVTSAGSSRRDSLSTALTESSTRTSKRNTIRPISNIGLVLLVLVLGVLVYRLLWKVHR